MRRTILSLKQLEKRDLPSCPYGPEFRVNSHTAGGQGIPQVAMDTNGDFVAVWDSYNGQDGNLSGVFGQRYNANGVPQGAEFRVNTTTLGNQELSDIAMDAAGNFVVVWQSNDGVSKVNGQRYSASGLPIGGEFLVSSNLIGTVSESHPTVAMDSAGDFVVAWNSSFYDGGPAARLFGSNGSPLGPDFRVAPATAVGQGLPSVAMDASGDFVVALRGYNQALQQGMITAQLFNAAGISQGNEIAVSTSITGIDNYGQKVAMDAMGEFVIVWQQHPILGNGGTIFARRFFTTGTPQGSEFVVPSFTSGLKVDPAVAMDASGNFVVSWTNTYPQDGNSFGVFAQSFDSAGSPVGTEFRANTTSDGGQFRSAVAMGGHEDSVVVWSDDTQDKSLSGVYAQCFEGAPRVVSAKINNGSMQRSVINSLTITFCEPVAIANAAALQLARTGPAGPTGTVALNAVQSGNVVTLSFANGGEVPIDQGGSLIDGRYQLTLSANLIHGPTGLALDGDNNHAPGGNFVMNFHRLFGDSDGDGTVAANDFVQFRLAFGGSNIAFDFDNDGAVSASDFIQFRLRFGGSI